MGRTLQIRNVPEEVYQALASRAEREGRSMAQQALQDLKRMNDQRREERRHQVLDTLAADYRAGRTRKLAVSVVDLVREDRER